MALSTNCDGYFKLEADGTDSVGTLGTATGTAPSFTTGKIGNGGSFAVVSSQYLETAAFVGSTDWSVNYWINPTTLISDVAVCRDLVAGGARVFSIVMSALQITLYAWGNDNLFHQTTTANHTMSTSTWYMWSAVWDSANNLVTLYKNASSFQTITLTGNEGADLTSTKLSIGRSGDATQYYNGIIDEVGYWSRALTSAEITTLYAGGSPGANQQYPFGTTGNSGFFNFIPL